MITTREIDAKKDDSKKKLKIKTTKEIEVKYIDKGPPQPPTGPMITTHNIEEFQKKAKKKKRVKKK